MNHLLEGVRETLVAVGMPRERHAYHTTCIMLSVDNNMQYDNNCR